MTNVLFQQVFQLFVMGSRVDAYGTAVTRVTDLKARLMMNQTKILKRVGN